MARISRRSFVRAGLLTASWAQTPFAHGTTGSHWTSPAGAALSFVLMEMDGCKPVASKKVTEGVHQFGAARVRVELSGPDGGSRWKARLRVIEGTTPPMMCAWQLTFDDWSAQHYVVFPGAVYAGNRFPVRSLHYPPRLEPQDAVPNCPVLISDVPRLEAGQGDSAIALRTSDCAQPSVGIWDPHRNRGLVVHAAPWTAFGDSSWKLQENEQRNSAYLQLCAPGVRPWRVHNSGARSESKDQPVRLKSGDELELEMQAHTFSCNSPEVVFRELFDRPGTLCPPPEKPPGETLQSARVIVEEKHLRENWSPETGLFFSRPRPFSETPYQAGWIGGMLAAWAFLGSNNSVCREHAVRHFVTALTGGMAPGGLFFGKATADGRWVPDFLLDTKHPWSERWTLVRRQADALYAGVRMANMLDASPLRPAQLNTCDAALQRTADALQAVWRKHGTFGQFLDQFNNDLLVGNSTSGALAPAALVLAGKRYRRPDLMETARQSAEKLYWEWTHRGVTCGGPGDALQCPDSESAFALVESFVTLARETKDARWMERASAAAWQAASWVMPYDYRFPDGSEFARLGMKTTGTVWANAQNKHSAPGICTLPGEGFAALHAQAANSGFESLMHSIHTSLPQYVSTQDRPIHDAIGRTLPVGWVNEKVFTCDFADSVGEVQFESSWCEISLLLSAQYPKMNTHEGITRDMRSLSGSRPGPPPIS